jgi:XTP/dITP diphosphohydrolase
MELIFASNNNNKLREIKYMLGNSITLLSLSDINIAEDIPENELTIEGNALQKARYIYNLTGKDVFADDTGLEIESLGGIPGVHSARFAGDSKDSDANIEKVLTLLQGFKNRKARFRTVIALIINGEEHLFEGIAKGSIITERRGNSGFGYDPVFVPNGRRLTFAEMKPEQKNKISHRAKAFNQLRQFLKDYINPGDKNAISSSC